MVESSETHANAATLTRQNQDFDAEYDSPMTEFSPREEIKERQKTVESERQSSSSESEEEPADEISMMFRQLVLEHLTWADVCDVNVGECTTEIAGKLKAFLSVAQDTLSYEYRSIESMLAKHYNIRCVTRDSTQLIEVRLRTQVEQARNEEALHELLELLDDLGRFNKRFHLSNLKHVIYIR